MTGGIPKKCAGARRRRSAVVEHRLKTEQYCERHKDTTQSPTLEHCHQRLDVRKFERFTMWAAPAGCTRAMAASTQEKTAPCIELTARCIELTAPGAPC